MMARGVKQVVACGDTEVIREGSNGSSIHTDPDPRCRHARLIYCREEKDILIFSFHIEFLVTDKSSAIKNCKLLDLTILSLHKIRFGAVKVVLDRCD